MNILITGGAGYIGSILVPMLLENGHKVTVVDNFMYSQSGLGHVCDNQNFDIIRGDVRNISSFRHLLNKSDLIIPLAALVGAPICKQDPIGATSINKTAQIELFKCLSNSQHIIMPTTNSAYGSGNKNNYCTEETPLKPISQYALEKVELEKVLMTRENSVSFRLATVFGMSPRMRTDLLVNDFVYKATNDGSIVLFEKHFKRNFIHVRDVARAFIHAIENFDFLRGEIFNVGLSKANLSKFELCERIKIQIPELYITEAETSRDPDQRNYIVSNDKIEKTGFIPEFSIDDGITELIKGYQMIKNNRYSNF